MNYIEIENLYKKYYVNEEKNIKSLLKLRKNKKEIVSLKDVNLKIKQGECVGLIGMNGAGKSTLIKIMIGILQPTSGMVKLFDTIPYKNRKINNYKIATVFGQRTQLRWDLSVKDSYELIKEIYNVNDFEYDKRLNEIWKELNIKEYFNQPVRTLSLGQKMRAELGAAFLYDAKILFLDEPTIGVDFYSKEAIIMFIRKIKQKGVTIILTSHDIDDVRDLCERVIVLDHGSIVVDTRIEDLNLNDRRTLIIELKKGKDFNLNKLDRRFLIDDNIIVPNATDDDLQEILVSLGGLDNIHSLRFEGQDFKEFLKGIYKKYGN